RSRVRRIRRRRGRRGRRRRMTEVKRAVRVAERLRQELALALRSLRDPRLAHALVTRVEVTDDLQTARLFVRLEQGGSPADRRALLDGLGSASGRLRRDVVRSVGLRVAPTFRYAYDEGMDASDRIEAVLREIRAEARPDDDDDSGDANESKSESERDH